MNSRRIVWLSVVILGLLVLGSRYRSMTTDFELNFDESHLAAQAMRYRVDPMPWRSVDGETSGPLSAWFLLVVHALGVPLRFPALHAVAAVVVLAILGLLGWGVWKRLGTTAAISTLAVSSVWLSCDLDPDFVHFSTELMPGLLISAAFAAGFAAGRPMLSALILGFVPWSKLQAAPIGLALGLWLLIDACRGHPRPLRLALALCATALAPTAALVLLIVSGGAFREFWLSYVVVNVYYAGPAGIDDLSGRLGRLLTLKPISPWLSPVLALSAVELVCSWIRGKASFLGTQLLPTLVITVVAMVCAVRPSMDADHYEFLLVPPVFLLTANAIHAASVLSRRDILPWALAAGCSLFAMTYAGEALRYTRNGYHTDDDGLIDRVLADARRYAPGAKSFGYWGWGAEIFVRTGTVPPTRHSGSYLMTAESPARAFMRANYLEDTMRNPTDVFFDLYPTGARMTPISEFPELAAYLREHYDRVSSITTIKGIAVVYVRKAASHPAR